MRTAFIQALCALGTQDERVFLLIGDLGYSVVEEFQELFPSRFLNVGVAEQNMLGVAAGLSREGYTVFVYSIGNFPTLRCMEQIRYDVCYHRANVKIIAVGGGYAYGQLGTSHHATEDIGMVRAMPGIVVAAPGDPVEASAITEYFANHPGPCYMRLNKAGERNIHRSKIQFERTRAMEIREGSSTAILVSGAVLSTAIDYIESRALKWGLVSFPFVKPIDYLMLEGLCLKYQRLITLEEHQLSCGFGSAILEAINDLRQSGRIAEFPIVTRIGIRDEFAEIAGSQEYLRKKMGLDLSVLEPGSTTRIRYKAYF